MSSWDDLDSDQQWAYIASALGTLSSFADGKVKDDREDNSQMHFTGTYLGRPLRIIVDSDGKPEVHIKVKAHERGHISVDYDPEAVPKPPGDPIWDADESVRLFLAPGVFIDEPPSDLEEMKARLTPAMPRLIPDLLVAGNAGRVIVSEEEIEMSWFHNRVVDGDFAGRMRAMLDLAEQLAREL
ncbi:MAG: hypothetical protein ABI867_07640 [Kofleriaceae bacterium]